jgi:hypothetical protein
MGNEIAFNYRSAGVKGGQPQKVDVRDTGKSEAGKTDPYLAHCKNGGL